MTDGGLAEEARAIFAAALARVDVRAVTRKHVRCAGGLLWLGDDAVLVAEVDRLLVVAVGKAALSMAEEAVAACDGLQVEAVVVTNEERMSRLRMLPGAHPVPDERSLEAAEAVLELLARVTDRTVVLYLVSGGASAMMEKPLDAKMPMEDVAEFHRALVGSGLGIKAMNTLRKHVSAVKGGRLAVAAARARMQSTLLISDVPNGEADAIGSGPSLPDPTTLEDCRRLLGQVVGVPERVGAFFTGPLAVETPKPGADAFLRARWKVGASSEQLAAAAAAAARERGFVVEIDNRCDEWGYREAGRYLIERAIALGRRGKRVCVVSVGEVSVALPARVGEGGRNQQFALWCGRELARLGVRGTVLSAASDGVDGQSDVAGAVCDEGIAVRAAELGYRVERALAAFDATPLLRRIGATVETGPTGNNVRDLRLVLLEAEV